LIKENSLKSLGYDDILLLPKYSSINSRDDVNLYRETDKYIPIFSAPMKDISEAELVISICKAGGVGVLHRFFENDNDRYESIEHISSKCEGFGISIGLNDAVEEEKIVKFASDNGCKFVTIDSASGYLQKTIDVVKWLYLKRKLNKWDFKIIAGNVVDSVGCYDLAQAGADIIRVNIGSGLQCLTSKSIGIGLPPLTAIQESADVKKRFPNLMLLSDGGIYNAGQALKAMVFGADGVMIGSLFGRSKECNNDGFIYGMSSYKLQERMNKTKKSNEGTVTMIPESEIKPFKEIWNEILYGLRSGMSYIGCDDINKLHDTVVEYIVTK
jgi:IMP dehydrogenase